MALLQSLHGVVMRSYGVLIFDCLRSDCASTAFFALPRRLLIVKLSKSAVHTQFKHGRDAPQSP
jgi:hypothetical protein